MKENVQQSFIQYVKEKNQGKEQIDLYDENRKYIRTIYRGEKINKDEWEKCILCFVLDTQGNVLVENKRKEDKDLCSGHIKHNEVSTQALLRELYEELGINIDEALRAKHLDNIKIRFEETNNELQCFLDVFCLFRTRDTLIRIDEREIKDIERIPYKEFLKKFKNSEFFPYLSQYKSIVKKLEELFEKRTIENLSLGLEK